MRAPVVALLRGVLLGAVAVGAVACSPAQTADQQRSEAPAPEPTPTREVREVLAGQDVRLNLPAGDAPPRGLVLWFHGQSGDADDRIDGPFFTALRDDGWAVASSDFHEESWGNEASTEDTQRLLDWAEDLTGTEATLWVAGSMGGSVSLNAMTHGVTPPACWYGIKPALDLTAMQRVPGGPRFIATAFDLGRGDRVPRGRIPVDNIDKLPLDTRWRVVASTEDDWVPIDQNGGALAYGLDQRGAEVTYLPAQGRHEDPSHFVASDVVAFADTCLPDSAGGAGDVASD